MAQEYEAVEKYLAKKQDLGSVAHIVWGVLTVLSNLLSFMLPLVFAIVFIFYQAVDEKDSFLEKLGDVVEYGVGLTIGVLIMFLLLLHGFLLFTGFYLR